MSGQAIIAGRARGKVLASAEGISFWGGVDPLTGIVIDAHHPLHGQCLTGKILVMPTTRGSCSGSGVMLDLALNGIAPAAFVFREAEDVVTLGAMIAGKMFDRPVPVIRLEPAAYDTVAAARNAELTEDRLIADGVTLPLTPLPVTALDLTPEDHAMLNGEDGPARRIAMKVICAMASLQGAQTLIDVTQGHIDGCILANAANLRFAETMAEMGAKTCIPTSINAISVDHGNWRTQGVAPDFGLRAARLADAYVAMGARPTFTCAPYLLDTAPKEGEAIGWSESNAVVYANSVLGARTVKHPDYLDLFIAMTGRAPLSGVYLPENRQARLVIHVTAPNGADDALWPMLGYLAGQRAPDRIPLLAGLEHLSPSPDDLKAMCAAFGTTSAAPMLHVAGHTPEAHLIAPDAKSETADIQDLARIWAQLNPDTTPKHMDLIAFGSPHFSLDETRKLAALLKGKPRHPDTAVIVTLGREVLAAIKADGTLEALKVADVQLVADICWCSITEPVFPPTATTLMTNSGKYAHYGPGLSGRAVRFGSLADCATAAQTGQAPAHPPAWLQEA
ncbi:cis-3-hydroxy-L-proline dehydratase [Pseudorhodobacter aquimaris]|uniref:cis-3-hydroxy-L-proline dehydratase n=1 Tax=Pseudorhodobacter aquimaris TaxID=687412 RepID=UPI00067E5661|nr:aconitase family protein [Pseudorhodobacter aquimaris]